MTQQDFLNCIDRILKDFHFRRKGKDYYSQGNSDLLVIIHPQKSSYSTVYYLNVCFSLVEYDNKGNIKVPSWREGDTYGRIPNQLYEESNYSFDYSKYETTEDPYLVSSISTYMNQVIYPTLAGGVTYILSHPEIFPYGWLSPRLKKLRDDTQPT